MTNTPTIREYRRMGFELHRIYTDALHALVFASGACGKTDKAVKDLDIAQKRLSKARSALDDRFLRDYPNEFDEYAFYPGSD